MGRRAGPGRRLEWLKRHVFGRKSEKLVFESPEQLSLDLLDAKADKVPEKPETEEISYTRRKKRRGDEVNNTGLRFDDTVPVKVINVPAPELSGKDAANYEVIGEKVTHRLAQRPASYVVLEYHRPVLKNKLDKSLKTTLAPAAVLDRSFADVSLLAGILVDKFSYHLPLYRQHQRLANNGITISRVTLTNYVHRSIALLEPIHEAQWRHILKSKVLAADETPIKAGRKPKKRPEQPGEMKVTYLWPVVGDEREICFFWSRTRAATYLEEILGGFQGVLLSDGYHAYDSYARNKPNVTQAGCWAHVRRKFESVKHGDPGAMKALQAIAAIYKVEREIRERNLARDKTLEYRSHHAKPLVDAFFDWCETQRSRGDLVKSDPFAKALSHALRRKAKLCVYLSDPDVAIDTNHVERALRVIPMGRKNWLFCWTEIGAQYLGIIQSLLSTCRMQGVDPYTYLVDVLQRVASHPVQQVEELTPRRWKKLFAGAPLQSDLAELEPDV